jgi:hypothetical protein
MNVYVYEIAEKKVAAIAKVMSMLPTWPASEVGSRKPQSWLKRRKVKPVKPTRAKSDEYPWQLLFL